MIAIDTNLVVRVLTNDEPEQARRASALLEREPTLLVRTVLLESEWVLRHGYGLEREVIAATFRKLLGLPSLQVEDPEVVLQALQWYGDGLDFADALHLAGARNAGARKFATFDRAFLKLGEQVAGIEVMEP